MKSVLRRLYFYYFYSISVLTYLLLFPMAYCLLLNKKTYPLLHSLRRFWARMILVLTFIRCEVTKEFQPEKGKTYIYCGNHFSNLDIIVCLAYLPSYFGFLGKSLNTPGQRPGVLRTFKNSRWWRRSSGACSRRRFGPSWRRIQGTGARQV